MNERGDWAAVGALASIVGSLLPPRVICILEAAVELRSAEDDGVCYAIPPNELPQLDDHRQAAFRRAYRILWNEADSWEAVDRALFEIAVHPREPGNFRGLLIDRTEKRAYDILRRRGTRKERHPLDDALSEYAETRGNEDRLASISRVRAAVSRLPKAYRAVVVKHYFQGKSHEEIAEEMGVTKSTVNMRLYRARQRLAEQLGDGEVVLA